jgi:NADPH-dependent curcumin reductase CurA
MRHTPPLVMFGEQLSRLQKMESLILLKPFINSKLTFKFNKNYRVIKTRNGKYPLGTLVLAMAGWRSHFISNGEGLSPISFDIGTTPLSYTLGILGMPGYNYYFQELMDYFFIFH